MNRWIVTSHRYFQHEQIELAIAEKQRLEGQTGKPFYVHRIKHTIEPDAGEKVSGEAG